MARRVGNTTEMIHSGRLLPDELLHELGDIPIDRGTISQERLDLINRGRTNLFPWRGQFSPELIELLLDTHASEDTVVLDPFVGSGTTLFESARKSLACFGAEINPAAIEMSRTVHFANLTQNERSHHVKEAKDLLEQCLRRHDDFDVEMGQAKRKLGSSSLEADYRQLLTDPSLNSFVSSILVNVLITCYSVAAQEQSPSRLRAAFEAHARRISSLPYSESPCKVHHCDARALPLKSNSVDLIITSPPYINVFNYHQNYRRAMEMAGWNLLDVAKSEIGSNRKNRGNRFLTVVQYSIDMLQALLEMRRVLDPDGRIIIVVGRESKVRGMRFLNYNILAAIAIAGAGFRLLSRQERRFTNRFGKIIFEDLLHFAPEGPPSENPTGLARFIGVYFLEKALSSSTGDVRKNIESAIRNAATVSPSPVFDPHSAWGGPA
jgi:DNA modification methylase